MRMRQGSFVALIVVALAGCQQTPQPASPERGYGGTAKPTSPEALALSRKIQRYAVIIGISRYKHAPRVSNLKFAARDAKALYDFLTSPPGGGFPRGNVKLLLDRDATIVNVRSAINDFLAAPVEDDLVVIYFAGHGAPDPKNRSNLYLVCYDTDPDRYGGTALPMREIDLALKYNIKSKRVVVLTDACHAAGIGGGARTIQKAKDAAQRMNEYWKKLAASRTGITKIAASESDQLSQEGVQWGGGHGAFTYFLLQGLKGPADGWLDGKKDGFVTMAEAYEYLRDRVRRATRNGQCPWAGPYKDNSIPFGIADPAVISQVAARQRSEEVENPTQTAQPYTTVQVPVDSQDAVNLAMAYLKRGKDDEARQIVDVVLARHDKSQPDAMAMKVDFLLQDNDVDAAEDLQLRLAVAHPDHPKAKVAARLVYDYYRHQMAGQPTPDQMKVLARFLKRNPDSPHAPEAESMRKELQGKLRSSYEKMVADHVGMASRLAARQEFDKAKAELDQADATANEALQQHAMRIDAAAVGQARDALAQAQRQAKYDAEFEEAKAEAAKADLLHAVLRWQRFLAEQAGNPHADQAKASMDRLASKLSMQLQTTLDDSLAKADAAVAAKRFADAQTALDAANHALASAAKVRGISLANADKLPPLDQRLSDAVAKDKDYRTFASYESRATQAPDAAGRLKLWQEFIARHANSDYAADARKRLSAAQEEVKAQLKRRLTSLLADADAARQAKQFANARQSVNEAQSLLADARSRFGSTLGVDPEKVYALRKRILREQTEYEDDLAYQALLGNIRSATAAVDSGRASDSERIYMRTKNALKAYDKATALCDDFKQVYPASAHLTDVDGERQRIAKAKADFVETEYLRAMADARAAYRKRNFTTASDCVRVALLVRPGDRAAQALEAQMKPVLVVTAVPQSAITNQKSKTKNDLHADVFVNGTKVGVTRLRYDRVQKGRSYQVRVTKARYKPAARGVRIDRGGNIEVVFEMEESKLPPGFDQAFMLPDSDTDQYGNPVVTRGTAAYDPTTGYPYEIWLKNPRMEFVLIPAGEFMMGSPDGEKGRDDDEGPVHRVRITKPFYLGKYEVTQSQWRAVKGNNPSYFEGDRNPVEQVSWNKCVAFCKQLSGAVGAEVRLSTEAEWEYACRAGTRTRFSYGDDLNYSRLSYYAWYYGNSGGKTHPVGGKKPNAWGLYDMHGNVWEWCADWYDKSYYARSGSNDPTGATIGTYRVLRGGAWGNTPSFLRVSNRGGFAPVDRYSYIGFRCARTP